MTITPTDINTLRAERIAQAKSSATRAVVTIELWVVTFVVVAISAYVLSGRGTPWNIVGGVLLVVGVFLLGPGFFAIVGVLTTSILENRRLVFEMESAALRVAVLESIIGDFRECAPPDVRARIKSQHTDDMEALPDLRDLI